MPSKNELYVLINTKFRQQNLNSIFSDRHYDTDELMWLTIMWNIKL